MEKIDQFSGPHFFLSNYYSCSVDFYNMIFPSAEAALQASKCANPEDRAKFLDLNPSDAILLGQQIAKREDWDKIKMTVMNNILVHKFRSHPELSKMLLETGAAVLIHGNFWHDNFWGNCTCPKCAAIRGQNHLGRLLMRLRADQHAGVFAHV